MESPKKMEKSKSSLSARRLNSLRRLDTSINCETPRNTETPRNSETPRNAETPRDRDLGEKKKSFLCDVSQVYIRREESENFDITEMDFKDEHNKEKKKITIESVVNRDDMYKIIKISDDTFVFKFFRKTPKVNFEKFSSFESVAPDIENNIENIIEEDPALLEYGRSAIINIAEECEQKSKKTQKTARCCLNLNNLIIIATVLFSFINAALGEFSECENIPVTIIGATIGILNSIYGIMSIPSRGIKFKNMSLEFMKISRAARQSLFYVTSANEMVDFSNQLRSEADEIDLTNFKVSLNNSKENNFNKPDKDLNIEN